MLLDLLAGPESHPAPVSTGGAVVRLLDVDAPRWAVFLGETPHDFYQLPAYVAACAPTSTEKGGAVRRDGAASLLLPRIIRDIPGSDRRDAISPYGYPGPLVSGTNDPEFLSTAMAVGMTALFESGIVSLFVRLHPLLNSVPPMGVGNVVFHGETVSIDLTCSRATRFARCVNPAGTLPARSGKACPSRRRRLRPVRRVQADLPGTMDLRAARSYYYFGDAYFDELRTAFRGGCT